MLDYALLDALAAVGRHGSFERAANILNVTPSAISQRIKLLEERVGAALVQRSQPCVLTPFGMLLRQHVERVQVLEAELGGQMPSLPGIRRDKPLPFRIAVNDDSMSTWLIDAIAPFCIERGILLDIVVEDQDHTARLIRDGSVQGAITTQETPVQGWRVTKLGRMSYAAVCSPQYHRRHFPKGVTGSALKLAPQVNFSSKDELQQRFITRITRVTLDPPVHFIPNGHGFLRACTSGLAWGMCPWSMVNSLLSEGRLVELVPGKALGIDLYWQCWQLTVAWLDDFTAMLREHVMGDIKG
jgi:LysR family transcriptional regulator (chromosome initiation inhibitor)